MKKVKSTLIVSMAFIAASLVAQISVADVFRSVDADGNVTYSDVPHKGATKVQIQKPTIIPSVRTTSKLTPKKDGKDAVDYTSVKIISPANDETLRNIQSVSITGQVSPSLQARLGHRASFLFDGKRIGEPSRQLNARIPDIERGAHTLQLVILDKDGKTIGKSPVSTFFVHKNSILNTPSGTAASPAGQNAN